MRQLNIEMFYTPNVLTFNMFSRMVLRALLDIRILKGDLCRFVKLEIERF